MPKIPSGENPEQMSRVVDRLLAQLGQNGTEPAIERGVATHQMTAVYQEPRARRDDSERESGGSIRDETFALWSKVILGVALGALMTQWPYAKDCGPGLWLYLAAVGTVVLTGAWIGLASWKTRSGVAHLIALVLLYWGIVLAAEQVLPRIGYAAESAHWRCTTGIFARSGS